MKRTAQRNVAWKHSEGLRVGRKSEGLPCSLPLPLFSFLFSCSLFRANFHWNAVSVSMAISLSRDVTYHEHRLGSTALVLWWIACIRVCSSRSSKSCDNPAVLPPYRCTDGIPTLLLVLTASGPPYSHLPCKVDLWLCILVRYQGRLKENNNGNQNFRQ